MLTNLLPEISKNAPNTAKTEEEEILRSNTVLFPAKMGCWQHTRQVNWNTRERDTENINPLHTNLLMRISNNNVNC